MSSRATMHSVGQGKPIGGALGGYGSGGGGLMGILAALTGQNKITPGQISYDQENNKISATPPQGPSGLFGGAARAQAAQMQQQQQNNLANIYGLIAAQKERGTQEKGLAQTTGEETRKTNLAQTINDLAKHLNVNPEDVTGALKPMLLANAQANLGLQAKSLANPQAQTASDFGTQAGLTGMPPNILFPNVPMGGAAATPNIAGGITAAPGMLQGQAQAQGLYIDPLTHMAHPISNPIGAQMKTPISPEEKNAVSGTTGITSAPDIMSNLQAMPSNGGFNPNMQFGDYGDAKVPPSTVSSMPQTGGQNQPPITAMPPQTNTGNINDPQKIIQMIQQLLLTPNNPILSTMQQ